MTDIQHSFRHPIDIALTLQRDHREIDRADEALASAMTKAYDVIDIVNDMAFIDPGDARIVDTCLAQFKPHILECNMLGTDFQTVGTALHDAIVAARIGPQDRGNRDCAIELLSSIVFGTRRLMCLFAADKATQAIRDTKGA